jgi:hypothetical protein
MADYFFDTSALVKRHVTETGSAWVKSLVRAKAGHTLYIARITAVEVTSAITRRQHTGDLSPAQAGAILGHFRRHLTDRYRVIELTPALFSNAMGADQRQLFFPDRGPPASTGFGPTTPCNWRSPSKSSGSSRMPVWAASPWFPPIAT